MAIFKCKMCSHYDGEWCHECAYIKTLRKPCDTCRECKIKITEELSIYPYKLELPDWMVYLLIRIGMGISLFLAVLCGLCSAFFLIGAIALLLEGEIRMLIAAILSGIGLAILGFLCKDAFEFLHDQF